MSDDKTNTSVSPEDRVADPRGPFKVVGAEARREHRHAVFALVFVEDASGNRYFYHTSCFSFDLKRMLPRGECRTCGKGVGSPGTWCGDCGRKLDEAGK